LRLVEIMGALNVTCELLFRVIFSALWLILFATLAWVGYLTRASTGKQLARHAGWLHIVAVALAVPYFVGVLLYALLPSWIAFLWIPLPDWFRSIMVGAATLGILFAVWGLRVLGENWAPSASGVRNDTVLVTTGPYSIVRNPIYLGLFLFIPSIALVAASWLIVLPGLVLSIMLYTQMGEEEAMLIDRFGDAYVEYMKRTPRFIPKLRHEHPTPNSKS
jgi:protein-S-isoprenylcysteine O-methyltransferase Ste14